MSADRNELHELIDELPDEQLPYAAEALRRRMKPGPARTTEPFAWIGAGESKGGITDVARNVDEYLTGFGRDSL